MSIFGGSPLGGSEIVLRGTIHCRFPSRGDCHGNINPIYLIYCCVLERSIVLVRAAALLPIPECKQAVSAPVSSSWAGRISFWSMGLLTPAPTTLDTGKVMLGFGKLSAGCIMNGVFLQDLAASLLACGRFALGCNRVEDRAA